MLQDNDEMEATETEAALGYLRRAQSITHTFNILILSSFIVTAILIWTQAGQRLRWGLFGLLVLISFSNIRLMTRYLGLLPPDHTFGITQSSSLALIHAKSCLLYPTMAVILGIFPGPRGFYLTAMTWLIASALWALMISPLHHRLFIMPLVTEEGRRVMSLNAYAKGFGSCQVWLVCTATLFLWHTYGFSNSFWHFFWVVLGIAAALSVLTATMMWPMLSSKKK